MRTRPGLKDKQRREAQGAPVEAANCGRGVLVQLAHSLNRGQSSEVSQIERWRDALLGSVAASAVMLYGARPVRAAGPCATSGTTLNCTGTITGTSVPGVTNGGIIATNTWLRVHVYNLTANIAPSTANTAGISFSSNGAITIDTDASAFTISPTGAASSGIIAASASGSQSTQINITNNMNITSALGNGISASRGTGSGAVYVVSNGNISSSGTALSNTTGIVAFSTGGIVSIDSTGTVTSANGVGLYALTNGSPGTATIKNRGVVSGATRGIWAQSTTGAVKVDNIGNITSTSATAGNRGIQAQATTGTVTVLSTGDITTTASNTANNIGINAVNSGAGTVKVTNVAATANGIRSSSQGILAQSTTGSVLVYSTGNVTMTGTTVTANTPVAAIAGFNTSGTNAVYVKSNGTVSATRIGIYARSSSGTVTVDSTGPIISTGSTATNIGIEAINTGALGSPPGLIKVTNTGNITAFSEGILADRRRPTERRPLR